VISRMSHLGHVILPLAISALVVAGAIAILFLFLTAPMILFGLAFLAYVVRRAWQSRAHSGE